MMTLMARLCTLCALTAMIQMALGENDAKGSMRMIGRLLMLHLTLDGARCALCLDDGILLGAARRRPFCEVLSQAASVEAILACMMK